MDWLVYMTFGWLFASLPVAMAFGRVASLTGRNDRAAEDPVLERASQELRALAVRRGSSAPPAQQSAPAVAAKAETAKEVHGKRRKRRNKAA